ncbi:MAG: hypothetical protein ACLSCV_12125 [Acutalibacteraceae bacterium]
MQKQDADLPAAVMSKELTVNHDIHRSRVEFPVCILAAANPFNRTRMLCCISFGSDVNCAI